MNIPTSKMPINQVISQSRHRWTRERTCFFLECSPVLDELGGCVEIHHVVAVRVALLFFLRERCLMVQIKSMLRVKIQVGWRATRHRGMRACASAVTSLLRSLNEYIIKIHPQFASYKVSWFMDNLLRSVCLYHVNQTGGNYTPIQFADAI